MTHEEISDARMSALALYAGRMDSIGERMAELAEAAKQARAELDRELERLRAELED